jgi:hypothetical protein
LVSALTVAKWGLNEFVAREIIFGSFQKLDVALGKWKKY